MRFLRQAVEGLEPLTPPYHESLKRVETPGKEAVAQSAGSEVVP